MGIMHLSWVVFCLILLNCFSSSGFPLALMPQTSQKVLNSVVKRFSNQMLDNLFYHCIQQMLTESAKGKEKSLC